MRRSILFLVFPCSEEDEERHLHTLNEWKLLDGAGNNQEKQHVNFYGNNLQDILYFFDIKS